MRLLCLTDTLAKLSAEQYDDKTHSGVTCISMQLGVSARVTKCVLVRVCVTVSECCLTLLVRWFVGVVVSKGYIFVLSLLCDAKWKFLP